MGLGAMHLRYHLLAIVIAVAGLAASTDGASAAGCRAPRNTTDFEVRVDIDTGAPNVYNNMSKADLGTSNIYGGLHQILGTTQSGIELRWSISYQVSNWKNVYCVWAASADVDLSYQQLDVNIASEYVPGSCQYEAVLDHENEHVEVAQRVMQPYARQIQRALTSLEIPTARAPVAVNTPDDARAEVEAAFQRTLRPVRDQLVQTLREQQAHVDTPENYRRTAQRCSNW